MTQSHDPNLSADVRSVPGNSLDAGLTGDFVKLADVLGTTDHALDCYRNCPQAHAIGSLGG